MKAGRRPDSPWSRTDWAQKEGRLPTRPRCPHCGVLNDGWGDPMASEARPPRGGDVAMCFYCGGVGLYTDALDIVKPDEIEAVLIAADPEVKDFWRIREHFLATHPAIARDLARRRAAAAAK